MFKSIVAIFTAIVSFIGGCFSNINDAIFFPEGPQTESVVFAEKIGNGWNLGNTLDACNLEKEEKMGLESEVYWGNPYTTKEMIEAVKAAGFSSVRIPITWTPHMDENYTIDKAWLNRVKEIADMVLDCGMYAIINVHHDDRFWLITDEEHEERATLILTTLWAQVSEHFKDYDEHLVFETMNEPRVVGDENEWSGTDEYFGVVNRLNHAVLDVIRKSGGNNTTRFVMMPAYAARCEKETISEVRLSDDEHILFSVHFYPGTAHRSEFLDCEKKLSLKEKSEIYHTLRNFYKFFIKKGYGVVLGEYGWTDRTNLENLTERADFLLSTANGFGIPCIVWDNGADFRLFDRQTQTLEFPDYVKP